MFQPAGLFATPQRVFAQALDAGRRRRAIQPGRRESSGRVQARWPLPTLGFIPGVLRDGCKQGLNIATNNSANAPRTIAVDLHDMFCSRTARRLGLRAWTRYHPQDCSVLEVSPTCHPWVSADHSACPCRPAFGANTCAPGLSHQTAWLRARD